MVCVRKRVHRKKGKDEIKNKVRMEQRIFDQCVSAVVLGPVYTTVEKASGRSRMLGQDMLMVDVPEKN